MGRNFKIQLTLICMINWYHKLLLIFFPDRLSRINNHDFYYLGKADVELDSEKEETMQSKNDSTVKVVTMNLDLKNEIPINVYDYLVNGNN